jgi:hypothetical protein
MVVRQTLPRKKHIAGCVNRRHREIVKHFFMFGFILQLLWIMTFFSLQDLRGLDAESVSKLDLSRSIFEDSQGFAVTLKATSHPRYTLNRSHCEGLAVEWLESEGVHTGLSTREDFKRQLAFHIANRRSKLSLPKLLEMPLEELCRTVIDKISDNAITKVARLPSIRFESELSRPSTRLLSSSGSQPFHVALVLPFHRDEISKIAHMMESWDAFPPCSRVNKNYWHEEHKVFVHFVWAFALDFNTNEGAIVKETLEYLWMHHQGATKCFSSSSLVSLRQNSTFAHFDGACTSFYQLMGSMGDRFDAMQLLETDVRPIRANWLDAWLAFIDIGSVCSAWWVKGSPSMCRMSFGELDARHDMHINGNSLYALKCPEFDDYLKRVRLFYSRDGNGQSVGVGGCQTGRIYEEGYDHAMFQYRLEPENYIYSRRIVNKFVYSSFVMNLCEDLYSISQLLDKDYGTYLVHSKSVFLSGYGKQIYEVFNDVFDKAPGPPVYEAAIPLFRSGELDNGTYRKILTLGGKLKSNLEEHPAFSKGSWNQAYPGQVYLWSLDFDAGPLGCNMPLYREAGAVLHAEIDSDNCQLAGLCPEKGNFLKIDEARGLSWESGGRAPQQLTRRYFQKFRKDPRHQRIDAFICSYPVANCQIFLPFRKPIILYVTTRLEFCRHDEGIYWRLPYKEAKKGGVAWIQWLKGFRSILKQPGSVIVANNMYDLHYIKYFTGIDAQYIPTWCGDFTEDYRQARKGSMPYVGSLSYHPVKATVLVGPDRTNLNLIRDGSNSLEAVEKHPLTVDLETAHAKALERMLPKDVVFDFKFMSDLDPEEELNAKELSLYRAIVCMPYQVSTPSIFEYYRLNIPLFFPSKRLLKEWKNKYGILWEEINGWPERVPEFIVGEPTQVPNPKNDTDESFDYWLQFADWFSLPHVQQYDNFDHLMELLMRSDLFKISDEMKKYNTHQREELVRKWRAIFDGIRKSKVGINKENPLFF